MPESTWGLALNGARARIVRDLENRHDERGIPEELGLEVKAKDLSDLMADKPGRAFSTAGSGRSAMEYKSDPVEEEKVAFCREVADLLQSHLDAGDFDRLVIAAAPDMLGHLRDIRSRALTDATVAEEAKDHLKEDRKTLRHRLQEMMPSRLG